MVRAALTSLLCLWLWLSLHGEAYAQDSASDNEIQDAAPQTPLEEDADTAAYGATARVKEVERPSEEVDTGVPPQEVPGTFGDPYRIIETMPGAAPMVSGLPYVYVRGSPPSGNAYYYDGIPLPQLYHLGLGPAVLHPSMIGPLHFDPGVSSARYGRRLGAVIAAEGPKTPTRSKVMAEARLLDANAAFTLKGDDYWVMGAGRFGYPGLLAPAIGLDLKFSYWDYQFRGRKQLNARDYVEVLTLGSRDDLNNAQAVGASIGFQDENQRMQMEFHRLEARLVRETDRQVTGLAVRVGYDHSIIGSEMWAKSVTIAPRTWVKRRLSGGHRLEAGVDMLAASGNIRDLPRAASFSDTATTAVARNTMGAYLNTQFRVTDVLELSLGGRTDAWIISGKATPTFDPRVRVNLVPSADLEFHSGVGLTHQPVTFSFPLPGFTDVALDRGVQEAIQTEVGMAATLPAGFKTEANLFFHHYSDLLLPEIYLRALGNDAQRVKARSYGGEFFLRRGGDHDLSGFISYTLGFARAYEPFEGRAFSPEFDIRHVLNLVLQYRFFEGFVASVAGRMRSGKPANQFTDQGVPPYYKLRLPGFYRLDGRISYQFGLAAARLTVYAEVLNFTLAREAVDAECFFGSCRAVREIPIWFPNLGIRGEM